jgi:spore germination protein GerM
VDRRVRAPVTESAVAVALAALLAGPAPQDARAGLRTALQADTAAMVTGVDGDVVTIGLAGDLEGTNPAEQILAIAQLVFTLTEATGIRAVLLTIGGTPAEVPTGEGDLSDLPLTRADFASVAPGP